MRAYRALTIEPLTWKFPSEGKATSSVVSGPSADTSVTGLAPASVRRRSSSQCRDSSAAGHRARNLGRSDKPRLRFRKREPSSSAERFFADLRFGAPQIIRRDGSWIGPCSASKPEREWLLLSLSQLHARFAPIREDDSRLLADIANGIAGALSGLRLMIFPTGDGQR